MKRVSLAVALAAMLSTAAVKGDVPPMPWIDEGDVPLAAWSRSVAPKSNPRNGAGDLVLFSGPNRASGKRGVTAAGATFPLFGAKRGSGCSGRWLLVGPLAWTCADEALVVPDEPSAPQPMPHADGLLRQYYFVPPQGTSAYADLELAEEGSPDRELEGGWGVAVVGHASAGGERWLQTSKGLWVAAREVGAARPSLFHGEKLADGPFDLAWVLAD